MSQEKRFPFYKHLIAMECRKDILLENDFANTRTKDRNTSFFSKYQQKITKNKMRLAYFFGFCFIFSLNFAYDFFYQSGIYHTVVDKSQRLYAKINDRRRYFGEVDYNNKTAHELGLYFQRLENLNQQKEITSAALSTRIPAFLQFQDEALDVNAFVKFCLSQKLSLEELPTPFPL